MLEVSGRLIGEGWGFPYHSMGSSEVPYGQLLLKGEVSLEQEGKTDRVCVSRNAPLIYFGNDLDVLHVFSNLK